MGLTKTVLKRPITMIMAVLCLIVFGLQSVLASKLELTPEMEMPMLLISTVYPGASPEDVDDLVTGEIEDEIGSLSGVKHVASYSMENASIVMIQYDYEKDLDEAYDDLKKKMDVLETDLPDNCESPVILELNIDDMPSIILAVNHGSTDNLYEYVDNSIVPEIEKITEVAEVDMSGGQENKISIELIPEKLKQYHLNMDAITSEIASADFSYPAGSTYVGGQDLAVSVETEYDTVELLKKIPISLGNGSVIYLEDVANVRMTLEDASGIARFDGSDTISLSVKKQQSAAATDVSAEVIKRARQLMEEDPQLKIEVVNDTSGDIKASLASVAQTMVMAVVVSMLIIFLFFGELKASLIVGTSIPISILAALILMRAMGFSLNVITMSSLVLGVGMMVDNSIVVLESCFRSTQGKGIAGYREAALKGSGIVLESVTGSTVTTCVVFLPLALLSGMTGQLFKPLGYTIIFCMAASLVSAMTIVPLCYCGFRPQEKEHSPAGAAVRSMQAVYRSIMPRLLKRKKSVILVSVLLLAGSFWLAGRLRFELIPDVDQGQIAVTIETRPGLKLEEIDRILAKVEEIVKNDEDVEHYLLTYGGSGLSISGGSEASLTAYLKDDRKRETDQVIREWEAAMNRVEGSDISMDSASNMPALSEEHDLEYILESTQYDELKTISDQIAGELTERPEVTKVHTTLENAAPVVKVKVDAIKAKAENITPLQIAVAVRNTIDGVEAATLDVDGNETSIYVEYPDGEYDTIDRLRGMVLTSNTGISVALADVADISFKDSPSTIERYDHQYRVTITGDLMTEDERQMDAIDRLLYEEVVSKYINATISRASNQQDTAMAEEFSALFGAIATAVFLVFVVMAAQFESPKYSLMVMTTIPFALIGSFGLLYLSDVSISMVSLLGFLMLSGTVVNNGILYVDTANQYRSAMNKTEALIEAGATRLRPILMTTLTTVVSMIPMCFAYGDSGEIMQGLALVDVGGLLASTVLALLMLPVYYALMTPEMKQEESYD